jgi:hypothetical protein
MYNIHHFSLFISGESGAVLEGGFLDRWKIEKDNACSVWNTSTPK